MTLAELECRLCRIEFKIEHMSENKTYMTNIKSSSDEEEKRFRTIQRTVSRLQEEIKDKDRSIKKLQSKINKLEDMKKNNNEDFFTWVWGK